MIHVPFDAHAIYGNWTGYENWKIKAEEARKALVEWHAKPRPPDEKAPIDSAIYGSLKESLKNYFQQKCAYCDSYFAHVGFGDVDHFRPKGRVKENPRHGGYYWLTYDESNLLPSCEFCNRSGKRDHFPVRPVDGHVSIPGDVRDESPLLLHPYNSSLLNVDRHWKFLFHIKDDHFEPTGVMHGVTEEGAKSVEVYGLNRQELVTRRKANQDSVLLKLKLGLVNKPFMQETLQHVRARSCEHAAAIRATWTGYLKFLSRDLDRLADDVTEKRGG